MDLQRRGDMELAEVTMAQMRGWRGSLSFLPSVTLQCSTYLTMVQVYQWSTVIA